MEILMCVAVGILFAVAVFLILSRSLLRVTSKDNTAKMTVSTVLILNDITSSITR